MTDSELAADHTRPHTRRGHLHYLQSDVIGKRPTIDEHSSELVHPPLALEGVTGEEGRHGRQGRVAAEGLHLDDLGVTGSVTVSL